MKTLSIILIFYMLFPLVSFVYAEEKDSDLDFLSGQLDDLENMVRARLQQLEKRIENLEERSATFSQEFKNVSETSADLRRKHKEAVGIAADFRRLEERIITLEKRFSSAEKFITWITFIVSVLVILIGLFFSSKFINLHSDIKLLRYRLESEVKAGSALEPGHKENKHLPTG